MSKAYDGDIQLDASKNPMRIAAELIQWVMSQGERGHVRTNAWDYSTAFAFALGFRSKASGVGIALGLTLLAGCRFGAATACQVRGFYLSIGRGALSLRRFAEVTVLLIRLCGEIEQESAESDS